MVGEAAEEVTRSLFEEVAALRTRRARLAAEIAGRWDGWIEREPSRPSPRISPTISPSAATTSGRCSGG